jgi:hypothetical protein
MTEQSFGQTCRIYPPMTKLPDLTVPISYGMSYLLLTAVLYRVGYNDFDFFVQNGASQAGNGLLDSGLYIPAVERLY